MIGRAVVVWLGILGLAVLNGAAREAWLVPRYGDPIGRALSTVALCSLVFLITWLTIAWIAPPTRDDAWRVGVLWLGLTLAFEFLAGHYLFGKSWVTLLEDYDIRLGRIWVAVLFVVLLAPPWSARLRGRV